MLINDALSKAVLARRTIQGGLYSFKGQDLSHAINSTIYTSWVCDTVFPFIFTTIKPNT